MSDIFEKVKSTVRIADVVERFYAKPSKDNFVNCPFHTEKTGSLSIEPEGNYFTCFGCQAKGDMIHFVALLKNISEYDAAVLIAESFGVSHAVSGGNKLFDKTSAGKGKPPRDGNVSPKTQSGKSQEKTSEVTAPVRDAHARFIDECASKVNIKYEYLKSRGFTDETISAFKLGYDPKLDGIVIPYPPEFEYQIIRLFKPSDPKKPYKKPPAIEWGKEPLFNRQALAKGGVVFVVESQLCAISILQCGGSAVGLGGLNGVSLFLREIETHLGGCIFVIALDNDERGVPAQKKLVEALKKMRARFIEYNIAGSCKDPNDLLKIDAAALTVNIKAAIAEAENAPEIQPEIESEQPTAGDKESEVTQLLGQDITDVNAVFTAPYLDALGYAKHRLPAEYAKFRMKAKTSKIPLRDLENSIAEYSKKYRQQENRSSEPPLDLFGIDLGGAVAPKGWTITIKGGVRKYVTTQNGEHEIVACRGAVVVSARYSNVEDDDERLELSFYRKGTWKRITGLRPQLSSRTQIQELSKKGLRVTSETAKDLVSYLDEYEEANDEVIPWKRSTAKVGWIGATQFFPFAMDEDVVFEESGGGIFQFLTEQGDYALWKEMMLKLRKNKFARFITSASFASPLLIKMGVRPFIVHIWHGSASGKSAVLKAAISIWGDPEGIMGTASATQTGLEQSAGILNHLPYGVDEKQAADENKTPFSRVIYMLGEGQGKTRGAKGGGIQNKTRWHNVVIVTGEEPITSGRTKDGVQTRTLELYGKPVEDMDFASSVHLTTQEHFGHAGVEFMRKICKRLKTEPSFLVRKYTEIHEKLKLKYGERKVHLQYVAGVILSDYLAETLIFGTDPQVAVKESFVNGVEIYTNNAEQLQKDNVESGYAFTLDWLASNRARFHENKESHIPSYGKVIEGMKFDTYYVIATVFEDALKDTGYNVEQVIRGFGERDYLTWYEPPLQNRRRKHQERLNGIRTDMYRFDICKIDPKPKQLGIDGLVLVDDPNSPF